MKNDVLQPIKNSVQFGLIYSDWGVSLDPFYSVWAFKTTQIVILGSILMQLLLQMSLHSGARDFYI